MQPLLLLQRLGQFMPCMTGAGAFVGGLYVPTQGVCNPGQGVGLTPELHGFDLVISNLPVASSACMLKLIPLLSWSVVCLLVRGSPAAIY